MQEYSFSKIYDICEDGDNRFKNNVPPGFKDKAKQGLRQFSDLILWYEIMEYSLNQNKHILFITDDVKADWWESIEQKDGTKSKEFHSKLLAEFGKKTNHNIIALTSTELFSLISLEFDVTKQSTIEMALSQTNERYIDAIKENVFWEVQDEIAFSGEQSIMDYNHIGTEGLSELEAEEYELVDYELIEQAEKKFVYLLTYKVKFIASSQEYLGRDDDTKEIIASPNNQHEFEGILKVRVERIIDDFIDLIAEENFENVEIELCELEETKFIHWSEEEQDQYNICPRCGCVMDDDNYAGNGFCIRCTKESEDL